MAKYAVVIRHTPNNRPVTTGIIKESDDLIVGNMEHYLFSEAMNQIRRFKQDFIEFQKATWYIDLMEDFRNTPYETKEILPE